MLKKIFLLLLLFFSLTSGAYAQEEKSFLVLPFEIAGPKEYQYLAKGAKTMLTTRLTWPGHFVAKETDNSYPFPQNQAEALKILAQEEVNYLILGSITILGDKCSLDVKAISKDKSFPQSVQTSLDNLIPSLEKVAQKINQEVFARKEQVKTEEQTKVPVNSDFIYNETSSETSFYLNPNFKHLGGLKQLHRWRSQSLNFVARGMVAGDVDNDGQVEIVLMEKNKVHIFHKKDTYLVPLATYEAPLSFELLNINLADLNRDGYAEIIISATQDKFVRSFMLNFKDKKLQIVKERIPYLLNIVRMPPAYQPTLVGQKFGLVRLFEPDSVYELVQMQGEFQAARKVKLPPFADVFNFTYLPQGSDYKLIVNHDDHLYTYSSTNALQAKTEEIYAATSIGFSYYETSPGLGKPKASDVEPYRYFISGRLVPTNLDGDDKFELIVSRPISVSAQFFSNYRTFPQGEIHCLFWDGIGLNLLWKTRVIKGTIVDYGLYDLDNNGQPELVVCINTYPGATGLSQIKTIILSYPLQTSSTQK